AGMVIVAAKTDPEAGARGVSLFLVDADLPGFRRGRVLEKIGLHCQDTAELFFDEVALPADALLGPEGGGFGVLMGELPRERLVIAIMAVAAARGVLEETIAYVKERHAFGQPLSRFQNTRFTLAEVSAEIAAGEALVERCMGALAMGRLNTARASEAKLWASELQGRVADRCLQLVGGYGYMAEYPVARAFLDARVQRIYGGTSEIMKELIARDLLGR
ncbi:MAG: acyl-CoA dehydrogenase, partial [Rhodobacteraceae bacterium]|nr:acyl-CoA dehydrogenase [Paracoccaceae bacterium]